MGTLQVSKISFIEKFRQHNLLLFTTNDVEKLFDIRSSNTLKHLLMRLTKEKIIEPLNKGKYIFLHGRREPSDFEIANFLVAPSYISLESALSLYGIIDQFSYKITSITVKKTNNFRHHNKLFSYSKIKKEFFHGFVKQDNYLIAVKEKALFDFAYFVYKGLRSQGGLQDISSQIKQNSVKKYFLKHAEGNFLTYIKTHVEL